MPKKLNPFHEPLILEAGCDESGRGCLAGPVFAAAVILPQKTVPGLGKTLNDSKLLPAYVSEKLRKIIEKKALAYGVAMISHEEIDRINILNASIKAMHLAIAKLDPVPESLLIDGNRFIGFNNIPYHCVVKGDGLYQSIAAASILAKTFRDEYMQQLHQEFPHYGWNQNKGYATPGHKEAILKYGFSPYHRRSFARAMQLKMMF